VIHWKTAETGVLMGSVLVVFGLVPGLFQRFAEGVRNALTSLQDGNLPSARFQVHPVWQAQSGQPRWLAIIGAALIAGTLLSYFSN
jgi:hypothetical protein